MARNEALVFAALHAMQPARPLQDILDRFVCIEVCRAISARAHVHCRNTIPGRIPALACLWCSIR